MPESAADEHPNDNQCQQLISKLKELFQLDQSDLDFGLYRIMHAVGADPNPAQTALSRRRNSDISCLQMTVDMKLRSANYCRVRILSALVIVGFGVLAGLVSAWEDSSSMRIGMAALGLLIATPIAASILTVGRRHVSKGSHEAMPSVDDPLSADSIAENFGRDRGHPPYMKPPDALPDKHQFDPDRLG